MAKSPGKNPPSPPSTFMQRLMLRESTGPGGGLDTGRRGTCRKAGWEPRRWTLCRGQGRNKTRWSRCVGRNRVRIEHAAFFTGRSAGFGTPAATAAACMMLGR